VRIFVFFSGPVVSEYSQERIAKKRAPPVSSPIAFANGSLLFLYNISKMDSGSEAWRFTGGSSIE
jgi:hypothetical protein